MRVSKFFRFTIAGDSLDVAVLKEIISLDCNVYYKNIPVKKTLGNKERLIPQNTNRWVYSNEVVDFSKPETFLSKNLKMLKKYLSVLRPFIQNYECRIDLILYSGDKTDICLNAKQIKLLNDFGVKLYISFC